MKRLVPAAMTLTLLLAACERPSPMNGADAQNAMENGAGQAVAANVADNVVELPRSILRPEVVEKEEPSQIEPVEAVIAFGASPLRLDEAGRAAIDALFDAPATKAGGAIQLRGHSDSRGSDGDNKVASRLRAEQVRDYLVEKGVAKDRITLVALGEGRPVVPNVREDGSDDPEGRAKNRRVEIAVIPPHVDAPPPVVPQQADPVVDRKP